MFAELKAGQEFNWNMVMTMDVMNMFRDISLDNNPIHIDSDYAKSCGFGNIVCYGNLLGLMISSLVGVEMRKYNAMLISESILFRHPFYPGDNIRLRGIMENILSVMRVAEMKLIFFNDNNVKIAQGKCQVKEIEHLNSTLN